MRGWQRPPWFSRIRRLWARALEPFARGRRDADLDEEIQAHLELAEAEHRAKGLSADEARRAALRSFGGVLRTREAYRESRGFAIVDAVRQELRFAARGLRRSPTFTAVAVLTLALAIGANTAIFSVVYGALIKPLPYRDADRLVLIVGQPRDGSDPVNFAPAALPNLTPRMHAIDELALFNRGSYALSTDTGAEVVYASTVSTTFFTALGGRFLAGRPLVATDDMMPSVVIAARLARRLFGSVRAAIGASLTLTSHQYAVVGVVDDSFAFPTAATEVWDPAGYARTVALRGEGIFQAIARLKPGIELPQARADIGSAVAAYAAAHPEQARTSPGAVVDTSLTTLRDAIVGQFRPLLLILWATVGLVLLVACANLANLLLARNSATWHETAMRAALGASRARLFARHLVDSASLSIAGAAAGLGVAEAIISALTRLAPASTPWLADVRVEVPALLFTAALGVATTIGTGVLPALEAAGAVSLRHVGATVLRSDRRRLRRVLSLSQLAGAVVLVIGGLLLARSLVRLLQTDIGVNTRHVTTASVELEYSQHPFNGDTRPRVERLLSRVRAIPGVQAAGFATSLPPDSSRMHLTLTRQGDAAPFTAAIVAATPGYFRAFGLRKLQGRVFTDADDEHHPPVMVVGEATARRLFGDGQVIGRTVSLPMPPHDGMKGYVKMTLVGVVDDVKYAGLAAPVHNQIYRPLAQQPWPALFLTVRTDRDYPEFPRTLRRAIASVDASAVVSSIRTMEDIVSTDVAPSRFRTVVLVSFAALALAIAAIGLYGVIAYSVAQRTMEIGIRMALGARQADVMRMVLREGVVLGLLGTAIGLAGAYGTTRLLASLLYGVTATDPLSFLVAAIVLLAVALLATYLPARRAARVDPLVALRTE